MINQAFCRNKIGAGFYLNDTHNKETFLGYDLHPDFMASSDDCVPLTEPSVCFILEVKAGKEKPWIKHILVKPPLMERDFWKNHLIYFDQKLLLLLQT